MITCEDCPKLICKHCIEDCSGCNKELCEECYNKHINSCEDCHAPMCPVQVTVKLCPLCEMLHEKKRLEVEYE